MTETAYLFDPATRRPTGQIECQVCQITGKTLRPADSLSVPPPHYAECIVVLAGQDAWHVDLDASRTNALAHVDQLHAQTLRSLTGNATPEERDTWATKRMAAKSVLGGTAEPSQAAMIELEAREKQITSTEMAQRVLKSAAEFETLVGMAAAFRQKSRSAILAALDADALNTTLQQLMAEMQKAIAALKNPPAQG